jgi:hypothetical protein
MFSKIITHKNPDLDAVGFVYSARKKLEHEFSFELVEVPSLQQLKDPEVIVGDVGLRSHPELGYNPSLNNFDHHYGSAENSATYLFNQVHHSMSEKLVDYIDEVDTAKSRVGERNSLKVVIAGIRVIHKGRDNEIIEEGCEVLDWIENTDAEPHSLTYLPSHIEKYLHRGLQEMERIEKEVEGCEVYTSEKNRKIGYLISTCPVKSLVKEEMFAKGIDIAVVHYPSKRSFAIGCCLQTAKDVNLEDEIASELNRLEQGKGQSKETWAGHPDRIGSPKEIGSLLTKAEIIDVIISCLIQP